MPPTLDLPTVRAFTEDLAEQIRRCDKGEGSVEDSINHYLRLCGELRAYINQWARAIFTGQLEFDPDVETLLKDEARRLLHRAKRTAAMGRTMDRERSALRGLDALHYRVADLDYLLENWVSPCLAVSPAPRVKISSEVEQLMRERLAKLPALPADWQPADPEQRAIFEKLRAQ